MSLIESITLLSDKEKTKSTIPETQSENQEINHNEYPSTNCTFSNEEPMSSSTKLSYKLSSSKLPQIKDLEEFLKSSKREFEKNYIDKSVSSIYITDFNLIKKLGSGGFGSVILAESKQDKARYAIKFIDKKLVIEKKSVQYINREIKILQSVNFPFVIYMKYFFVDSTFLYIVMPFLSGLDFDKFLKKHNPLSETDAKFYIAQLVLALEYLHNLNIIHRDVKPENVLVDALGYLKLSDFGQCIRCHRNEKTWTMTGTPEYIAPEILRGKGYDYSVDWWSLGVTTYEVNAGFRPFSQQNKIKLYSNILKVKYSNPKHFSSYLKKFLGRLLVAEPSQRIANVKKASEVKKHVWLQNTDWLALLNCTIQPPYIPETSEHI